MRPKRRPRPCHLFVENDHLFLEPSQEKGPPSWALTEEELRCAERVILHAMGIHAKYFDAEQESYVRLRALYAPLLERVERNRPADRVEYLSPKSGMSWTTVRSVLYGQFPPPKVRGKPSP